MRAYIHSGRHWEVMEVCSRRSYCTPLRRMLNGNVAVILASPLVKAYLLNYARSLIYTTSLSAANVVAINCSFDLLEDGTAATVCQVLLYSKH